MTIGILTLQYPDNYGAMLQAYALKRFLESLQLNRPSVEIINYLPDDYYKYYCRFSLSHLKYAKRYLARAKNYKIYKDQSILFDRFRKESLLLHNPIRSEQQYKSTVEDLDFVVYGSDQVWNNVIVGNNEIYYGKYVPEQRRISYAASFGFDNINEFQTSMVRKYIIKNRGVSCRERSGCDVIQANSQRKDITTVCDPVFLLSLEEWRRLAKNAKTITDTEPYILYYSLANNRELISYTEELQRKTEFQVICIHPLCKFNYPNGKGLKNVGPIEFISLIDKASYICSDSFHALCFSMILGKEILSVPSPGKGKRLTDLLNSIEIQSEEHEYCGGYHYDMKNAILLYGDVIEKSKEYLVSTISQGE